MFSLSELGELIDDWISDIMIEEFGTNEIDDIVEDENHFEVYEDDDEIDFDD